MQKIISGSVDVKVVTLATVDLRLNILTVITKLDNVIANPESPVELAVPVHPGFGTTPLMVA